MTERADYPLIKPIDFVMTERADYPLIKPIA